MQKTKDPQNTIVNISLAIMMTCPIGIGIPRILIPDREETITMFIYTIEMVAGIAIVINVWRAKDLESTGCI